MAKAKANSTTKDNPAIQRAGRELVRLIPIYQELRKEDRRTYRLAKPEISAIEKKYERFYNPFKGFPSDKARLRDAEWETVYRKHGYKKASASFNRVCDKMIALAQRITHMKPQTLNDLAVQVHAFDLNATIHEGLPDNTGPEEDFALHFAKFCRVKLFRKWGA